ncbi:hypothetical protein BGU45_04555 [Clostridioides difficile]|uniref:hypothetical protein n=1 Tax=Clostridioides difficile TaxID=1496 RepID=UPI000BC3E882|nr:hypothetical protein [Clostridioides difficile]PBF49645.1 hypothetical protein BGU45_04555 [Clostridioides difficile]
MKKIIYVLFTIELLIVSLLGLNIVKDNEINNILYNETTSISVMFKDYKKLNKNYSKWIKDIADDKNVTMSKIVSVSSTHLRSHETGAELVCRLLLETKKKTRIQKEENNRRCNMYTGPPK